MGPDVEDPSKMTLQSDTQEIIRAIDSNELQGFNSLEAHDADKWFVELDYTDSMKKVA